MGKNGFFEKSFKKVKAAASEKMAEYKREKAYERAASKQIKSKARVAGYKAKEKQAVRYAEESARYKTTQKLKAMKRPRPSFSGFGSTTQVSGLNTMLGGSNFLQGYASRAMGKPTSRKKKPQKDTLSKMLGV